MIMIFLVFCKIIMLSKLLMHKQVKDLVGDLVVEILESEISSFLSIS